MTVGGYLLWWDMSKKEKLILIAGIAVILICTVFVLFMLDRSSVIRIFPRPAPKQEKVIQLDNLGSADTPTGKTAIITIFCDDKLTKWDFGKETDAARRKNVLKSVKIASEWLMEQAQKYNKDLSVAYPADENSDLYYQTAFDDVVCDCLADREKTSYYQYIEKNVDVDGIKKKYGCENIVYLLFANEYDESKEDELNIGINAYAVPFYDKEKEYPYELCCIPSMLENTEISPAVIAHEILHLFGAPDLYAPDAQDIGYLITMGFVDYCKENYPQDIMLSTYDRETDKRLPDRITQEITDITAYYIGWLETAPDCIDEYLLVHSQHEYKNRKEINLQ